MIVFEKRPSWLRLIFSYRGTALSHIGLRLFAAFLVSIAATAWWMILPEHYVFDLTPVPFTLIGLALGIFLGFRNNTSYDRFWEARKLWGRLVNTSRSMARQILTLLDTDVEAQHALVHRLAGYPHALRLHLRGEKNLSELGRFYDDAELVRIGSHINPPVALLQTMGDELRKLWKAGAIDTYHLTVLEGSLTDLTDIQGGCERIRNTPIPFAYTVLIHRIVGAYCFFLAFGIVATVHYLTPVVVLIVSYAFFGLDEIGDEIEEPFGTDPNDLPLSQLSTMIEINLRQGLGESHTPAPVRPIDGVLS